MSEIVIDRAFPGRYELRLIDELPGTGALDHDIARSGASFGGALLIAVEPEGGVPWTAAVAGGTARLRSAHTGVHGTPSPTIACAVARGDAYLLDVTAPACWRALEDAPVTAALSAVADGLLLLATPWRVIAVGADGVAWRTPRLAIDGVAFSAATGGRLTGVADPAGPEPREFTVELATGRHGGGFTFPA